MELKNYTSTKEENYEELAQHLNVLAEAITQDPSEVNFQEAFQINQFTQEALQFLKQLI
ncbi:hypothetical protein HUW51_22385 [Adhaeribacter swui]|uniref:Uncharacterized protein n=1 Tax=Adhaeribacter swui TaxID=2086471 RepID=A0A7G7GDU3_9BACT|nr:hypothetical protein [Adhaeribacter swui]QNF35327.1 hypothetical protein HUW51_22385 [Adhaeribacter swui]